MNLVFIDFGTGSGLGVFGVFAFSMACLLFALVRYLKKKNDEKKTKGKVERREKKGNKGSRVMCACESKGIWVKMEYV